MCMCVPCTYKSLAVASFFSDIKTLAPQKKSYDKPRQHVKEQRHTLPTKVHIIKAMVFSVVMYGCESWTIKKAQC